MVRGTRLAVGIALGSAALLAAAFALAWHPEIERITPPAAASFGRALVLEGEDLARLGNCAGCHTADPARPLAGGRALPTPFGTVFATNITPDAETGIGAWSREAFDRAMRRGIGRNGEHLYPAFPYDHFTHVSDGELDALYAWLMTRPPVRAVRRPTQLDGVLGFRPLVAAWNLLYLERRPTRRPIRRNRPTGIAAARWPKAWRIAAAATRRATAWAPRTRRRAFDGAWTEGWYAPPLNAHSPAVRPWTVEELHVYLRTGLSPTHAAAAGPMGGVTRALSQVRDEDVHAIAVYFASLMAQAPAAKQDRPEPVDRQTVAQQAHPEAARLVRRRLRGLPRARRADDAAGPAAARLGHAAARGQCARHGAHHHEGPRPAGRPDRARRCRPSPTMLDDRQLRELTAYLRVRFTDKSPWSDIGDAVAQAREGEAK